MGPTGKSLRGVIVTTLETGRTATVDSYGHYAFLSMAPGTYTLIAAGEGFSRLKITDVVVKPNTDTTLGLEEMPVKLKAGEVQTMEEVVVSAKKNVLEQYTVVANKIKPYTDRNMDLPRGIDDVQPYYIFDSRAIDQSGAVNLQDFLKQRLTMNAVVQTPDQKNASQIGAAGTTINLRGLGTNQTLILIDGQRVANLTNQGGTLPPDINGLPLSAIDRVEVLPSSASAIYGGSALGGVVNIVLKKDYRGGELRLNYGNTANTDSPVRSADLIYGFNLEGGKTRVMLLSHYSDAKPMLLQDRIGLVQRGLSAILKNSPSLLYSNFNVFLGATPNVALSTAPYIFSNGTRYTNPSNTSLILKNGTSLSSLITSVPAGAAPGADISAALLAHAGTYNLALGPGVGNNALQDPIGIVPKDKSFMATIHRQMSAMLDAYGEFSTTSNGSINSIAPIATNLKVPGSLATNPFVQNVSVSFPTTFAGPEVTDSVSRSMTLGLLARLPAGWNAKVNYTWSSNAYENLIKNSLDTAALNAAIASGAVNLLVDTLANPPDLAPYATTSSSTNLATSNDLALRFAGPLFSLPTGAPTLALGLDHRKEGFEGGQFFKVFPTTATSNQHLYFFGQTETQDSVYAEATVPIVPAKTMPLVRSLEFQAAVRNEHYSVAIAPTSESISPSGAISFPTGISTWTRSSYVSTNPTLGLKYKPTDDLTFRASYSKAFLPPTWMQLAPNTSQSGILTANIIDPLHPALAPYSVTLNNFSAGNPATTPQRSRDTDLGVIWEPKTGLLAGLRLNIEHYKIEEFNAINGFPNTQDVVNNFPDRIVRDPASGLITAVDVSTVNFFGSNTSGWDYSFDYTRATPVGAFRLSAMVTVVEHFTQQVSASSGSPEYVGYAGSGGPSKTKGNATLGWEHGPWNLAWTTTYFGSYRQVGSPGDPNGTSTNYTNAQGGFVIRSQVYHELVAAYSFGKGDSAHARLIRRATDGLSIQVGVKNLFNSAPPFDAFYAPYYYSTFGNIRLRDYWVSVKKEF